MCLTPKFVIDKKGLQHSIACRKCKLCRSNRVNDWVGRGIAEKQNAAGCSFVTLTYGGDDRVTGLKTELGASILIYADVQRYIRKYRDAGYPCRYMLSGEYGDLKGRSHWHLLLFWEIEVPPVVAERKLYTDSFWCHGEDSATPGLPFGYTYWVNDVTERDIRYVCKYLLKSERGDTIFKMSRFPPIGHEYFRRRAHEFVKQRLLPQDAFYSFPDTRDRSGVPRRFMMSGVTLDNFCREVIAGWECLYGEHPLDTAHSPFLLDWCDRQAQRTTSELIERRSVGARPTIPVPEHYGAFYLWETRNVYVSDPVDGFRCLPRLFWSFDEEGYPSWRDVIVTAKEASLKRGLRTRSVDLESYRLASAGLDRRRIR